MDLRSLPSIKRARLHTWGSWGSPLHEHLIWAGGRGLDSPSGPSFFCLQVFIPAPNHLVFFNQSQTVLWTGY